MRETWKKQIIFSAVVRVPYKLSFLGRGAPQVVAERRVDDVGDSNDDHEPGEANGPHSGTPGGRTCEE